MAPSCSQALGKEAKMIEELSAANLVTELIAKRLKLAKGPMSFVRLSKLAAPRYAPDDVRDAIWTLVEHGQVVITNDWKVRLVSTAVPGRYLEKSAHGRAARKPQVRRSRKA